VGDALHPYTLLVLIEQARLVAQYSSARNGFDMDLNLTLQRQRELRAMGKGPQVREMLMDLQTYSGTALELAQIGIEMNYAGMFSHAEKLLGRAMTAGEMAGYNVYIARTESCIAKYSLGKFYDAHALFHATRMMRDEVIRQLYGWSDDPHFLDLVARKFLGAESVSGKSILVAHEGGFGDLVMHARYLKALRSEGAHAIYVETPQVARGMFASEPWIVEVADLRSVLPHVDFVTWNFDLYSRYQQTPFRSDPSWAIKFFPHQASLPASAQGLLDSSRDKLRIGLLSASNSNVRHEPFRSVPQDALIPLVDAFRDTNVQFYSLNRGGNGVDPRASMEQSIVRMDTAIRSFADTAAIVGQLDLLISIDTGPAHLAAALKRPVWLLLSAACDCRWYDCQHCTPWYDSMRLYRQDVLGDWTQAIKNIIADLSRLCDRGDQ
jgi:Glycosyltransferase family 9 (heptosyltransferase)